METENGEKKRNDKRSERTKKLISDTFIKLLRKRMFNEITVNEICLAAELSRATFYMYFEDKYALLRYTVGMFQREIRQRAGSEELKRVLPAMVAILSENKKVMHHLAYADKSREMQDLLHNYFVDELTVSMEKQQREGITLAMPVKMLAVYHAAGMTYLIYWWLEGGFDISEHEFVNNLLVLSGEEPIP